MFYITLIDIGDKVWEMFLVVINYDLDYVILNVSWEQATIFGLDKWILFVPNTSR